MKKTSALSVLMVVVSASGFAQFNGSNLRGDFGLKSGSQAPAGIYIAPLYVKYSADTIKNRFGDPLPTSGQFDLNGGAGIFLAVTKAKLLGANYGFMVAPGVGSPALEAPRFNQNTSAVGFLDLYIQPLNLGWHSNRIDTTLGYGVFAPTGRYAKGADDNVGLGMWSHEFWLGSTVFFDEARKWHLATTGYYEVHTTKRGQDLKVGDILTLEGGLGRDFLKGAMSVGAAYYAQIKMTPDGGSEFPSLPGIERAKHRFYGVGPEIVFPIANKSKTKLIALLTFRYQWEFANVSTLQGDALSFSMTFPLKAFK